MSKIGRVTVGSTTNHRTVRIRQQTQTSIASPVYSPTIDIALDDLTDVVVANPQENYVLVFNETDQKFEVGPQRVTEVIGGTF